MSNSAIPYRYFGVYRLLLALLVFNQHSLQTLAPEWIRDALAALEVGTVAVLMFFVLSGFIVTEAALEFYRERPGAFLVNRLLRIYPSYLIALVLTVALALIMDWAGLHGILRQHLIGDPEYSATEFLANAAAILPGGKTILDHAHAMPLIYVAWALRVELAFYFVLFVMLAIGRWSRIDVKYWLAASGLAALAVWGITHDPVKAGFFDFAPHFVLGSALYVATIAHSNAGRAAGLIIAAAASIEIAISALNQPVQTILSVYTRDTNGQFVLFSVLMVIWLALVLQPARPGHSSWIAWDRLAGEITFPLYLLHMATSTIVDALIPSPGILAYLSALAASLAAALAATLTYEAAIGRLRTRIRGINLAAAPTPIDPVPYPV